MTVKIETERIPAPVGPTIEMTGQCCVADAAFRIRRKFVECRNSRISSSPKSSRAITSSFCTEMLFLLKGFFWNKRAKKTARKKNDAQTSLSFWISAKLSFGASLTSIFFTSSFTRSAFSFGISLTCSERTCWFFLLKRKKKQANFSTKTPTKQTQEIRYEIKHQ